MTFYPLLAYVLITGIIGDVTCKYATTTMGWKVMGLVAITAICWGTNAIAWYNLYRLKSITEMVVLFNFTQIIALSLVGVVWFNEPLTLKLVAAFVLMVISFWLLS